MSDFILPSDNRLQASHDRRRQFETVAYIAGGGVFIAVATLIVVGIAMPPPAPCAPDVVTCVPLPDWGAAIVAKAKTSKDVLLDLMLALGGWTGITLIRGHMDARLPSGPSSNREEP